MKPYPLLLTVWLVACTPVLHKVKETPSPQPLGLAAPSKLYRCDQEYAVWKLVVTIWRGETETDSWGRKEFYFSQAEAPFGEEEVRTDLFGANRSSAFSIGAEISGDEVHCGIRHRWMFGGEEGSKRIAFCVPFCRDGRYTSGAWTYTFRWNVVRKTVPHEAPRAPGSVTPAADAPVVPVTVAARL